MRKRKPFGILSVVGPIVYCGGLVIYFLNTSGSVEDAVTIGLGPTLLGLTIVGLLFCIPLILGIIQIFVRPRWRTANGGGPDAPLPGGGGGPDIDAMIARHMERMASEPSPAAPATPSARDSSSPTARSGFGRKRG